MEGQEGQEACRRRRAANGGGMQPAQPSQQPRCAPTQQQRLPQLTVHTSCGTLATGVCASVKAASAHRSEPWSQVSEPSQQGKALMSERAEASAEAPAEGPE